jgi:carbonic anhydrase
MTNKCVDCSTTPTSKERLARCRKGVQSPIDLPRNITAHQQCHDRHLMRYVKGDCRFDQLDFQVLPHVLRAYQPQNCTVEPTIDFSFGYPFKWVLEFTDISVPSQHTQDGRRYDAEIVLSHTYKRNVYGKHLGNVAIFLEKGTTKDHYRFLELYLRAWTESAAKAKQACKARGYRDLQSSEDYVMWNEDDFDHDEEDWTEMNDEWDMPLDFEKVVSPPEHQSSLNSKGQNLIRRRPVPRASKENVWDANVDNEDDEGPVLNEEWDSFMEEDDEGPMLNEEWNFVLEESDSEKVDGKEQGESSLHSKRRDLMQAVPTAAPTMASEILDKKWYRGPWHPYDWVAKSKTEYYFRYLGSLMEPPCFTGVHWRVMRRPIKISPRQLSMLEALLANRLNPDTCEKDTVGKLRPDGQTGKAVDVNRPIQQLYSAHGLVYCECVDWKSSQTEDQIYCNGTMEERGVSAWTPHSSPSRTLAPASSPTSAPASLPALAPDSSPTLAPTLSLVDCS